jgi:CobQ-like glutamine amidotransferase family enzyme
LNLYGDRGNVLTLAKRLEWRGIEFIFDEITVAEHTKKLSDYHLFFIGGGQDSGQTIVAKDLLSRKQEMIDVVEAGATVLSICGGYQLLGKTYETSEAQIIEGLGILDVETRAPKIIEGKAQDRLIGNVTAKLLIDLEPKTIVGFENHSGRTYLKVNGHRSTVNGAKSNTVHRSPFTMPLAKTLHGYGNNGEDDYEGAVYKNLFGTYLHGSLLPKNPHFADELLRRALAYSCSSIELKTLDDKLELRAHRAAIGLK